MILHDVNLRDFPIPEPDEATVSRIEAAAKRCRSWIVTMTTLADSGHPAGSLSSLEMYLLVYGVAKVAPENWGEIDRDFVVVSHGHTSPGAYAALAAWGFVESGDVLAHFRSCGSPFQGHVERDVPGIDWGSGNLGQGLSAGVGYALAQRIRGKDGRVFVLMGDGEQVKGQIAEARRMASKEKLSNLTALIDCNDIQISGRTGEIMPASLRSLWEADGWRVLECDGHDVRQLYASLRDAATDDLPTVLFCRTKMGHGVSFMEDRPDYHGKAATGELYVRAMEELGGDPELLAEARRRRTTPPPQGKRPPLPPVVLDSGEPFCYGAADKTDNRSAFGKALADVGERNYKRDGRTPLVVFDCDLAGSVKVDGFAKKCPDWFIQAGIQEHSTAATAGAASLGGVVPLWADFGVFGICEVYNQQRLNDINGTNLKLVLTHVGLDVGEDGMTHQCIDYVGLLRNTFGWKLVVPADPNQTDKATRYALSERGNVCLAMGRSKLPVLLREDGTPFYGDGYVFRYGKADLLRDGTDGAILCMGHMAWRALAVRELLAAEGFSVKVLVVSCPLALEEEMLRDAAATGLVVTYEDHHVASGLGASVGLGLLRAGLAPRFASFGVHRYGDSGPSGDVFAAMGLAPEQIAEGVRRLAGSRS